jgi:hypothetical protein
MTAQTPDIRPHVVVLSRDDYNRARIDSPELLVDPLTRVVAVPLRSPDNEDPALLAVISELRPATVLIRNTWAGGAYIGAAAAYETISLAKFNLFANVCQILGATRLEVKELREVSHSGIITGKVAFKASAADGNGSLSSESSKRLAQSIQGLWVWQSGKGNAAQADAYVRAEHIAGDPVIAGLIQQRRYASNALKQHVLKLNITSEAQRAIQAALEVNSVLGRFGPAFKSTFDSLRKHNEQLVLDVNVEFASRRNEALIWPGLAWPGLAWPGLAWPGRRREAA